MDRTHLILQLVGWILFLVCSVLFLAAGIRAGDPLVSIASVVFLVACVLFIVPLVPGVRRVARRGGERR